MQHIVVATDHSESGHRAVRAAADLAAACAAKMTIVTVQEPGAELIEGMAAFARIEGGMGEAVESIGNNILQHARGIAERQGAHRIEVQSCWGDPSVTLIDAAQRLRPDVLIVGRRGRGRLAGLLLGSVSQKLVSLCPCAVMVVP